MTAPALRMCRIAKQFFQDALDRELNACSQHRKYLVSGGLFIERRSVILRSVVEQMVSRRGAGGAEEEGAGQL